jgi:hypothetical protein
MIPASRRFAPSANSALCSRPPSPSREAAIHRGLIALRPEPIRAWTPGRRDVADRRHLRDPPSAMSDSGPEAVPPGEAIVDSDESRRLFVIAPGHSREESRGPRLRFIPWECGFAPLRLSNRRLGGQSS